LFISGVNFGSRGATPRWNRPTCHYLVGKSCAWQPLARMGASHDRIVAIT
jgi:hypothetical protein